MSAQCQDCAIMYEVWPEGGCPNCRSATWGDPDAAASLVVFGDEVTTVKLARPASDTVPGGGETVADPTVDPVGSVAAPSKPAKRPRRKADDA
jgi:hypothetical protein